MSEIEKIAVIGAGLMGHGIGQIFAVKGHDVTLLDLSEDVLKTAHNNIRTNLELMADVGQFDREDLEPVLARITTTMDLEEAVKKAAFVFEAVVENLEVKQELFQRLDSLCSPETVLASNTSVISITEIAQRARHKNRIVGTHFWNPPYLIPLVEVVRAEETSSEIINRTFELLTMVGKHPVRVQKDVPGFVGNRLQHALWREAFSIVERGIADAATVDECIKYGFGLRLPVLGPLENADMVGTDLIHAIHSYILKHLEASPEPSPLLRKLVEDGDLGFKTGKGFQTWSEDDIAASRRRLKAYLLKVSEENAGPTA